MINKVKEYFKDKNPYLLASFAVVIVSVLIIFALLQEEKPAESEGSVTTIEQISETTQESLDAITETGEQSQSETLEESSHDCKEDMSIADVQETEVAQSDKVEDTQEVPDIEESLPKDEPSEKEEPEGVTEEPDNSEPEQVEPPTVEPERIPEVEPEIVPEELPEPPKEPEIHVHSWIFESYYQKPTCSNGGLVTQICAHCGETQITGGTPTGEHFYEVETQGDCCSAEVVVCTECNYREVREMDPTNHIDVEDGLCYGCGRKTE